MEYMERKMCVCVRVCERQIKEAGDRYADTGHTSSVFRSPLDRQAGRGSIMVVMILLWINQLEEVELPLGFPPQAINNQRTNASSTINTHTH